jgi:tetratricopeptide (TPR) repeat protein
MSLEITLLCRTNKGASAAGSANMPAMGATASTVSQNDWNPDPKWTSRKRKRPEGDFNTAFGRSVVVKSSADGTAQLKTLSASGKVYCPPQPSSDLTARGVVRVSLPSHTPSLFPLPTQPKAATASGSSDSAAARGANPNTADRDRVKSLMGEVDRHLAKKEFQKAKDCLIEYKKLYPGCLISEKLTASWRSEWRYGDVLWAFEEALANFLETSAGAKELIPSPHFFAAPLATQPQASTASAPSDASTSCVGLNTLDPDLQERINKLVGSGEFQKARDCLTEYENLHRVELSFERAECWLAEGRQLLLQGYYDRSIDAFGRADKIFPKIGNAHICLELAKYLRAELPLLPKDECMQSFLEFTLGWIVIADDITTSMDHGQKMLVFLGEKNLSASNTVCYMVLITAKIVQMWLKQKTNLGTALLMAAAAYKFFQQVDIGSIPGDLKDDFLTSKKLNLLFIISSNELTSKGGDEFNDILPVPCNLGEMESFNEIQVIITQLSREREYKAAAAAAGESAAVAAARIEEYRLECLLKWPCLIDAIKKMQLQPLDKVWADVFPVQRFNRYLDLYRKLEKPWENFDLLRKVCEFYPNPLKEQAYVLEIYRLASVALKKNDFPIAFKCFKEIEGIGNKWLLINEPPLLEGFASCYLQDCVQYIVGKKYGQAEEFIGRIRKEIHFQYFKKHLVKLVGLALEQEPVNYAFIQFLHAIDSPESEKSAALTSATAAPVILGGKKQF